MSDTTTKTYKVTVHKANVPLQKGESLGQFTNELRKQAKPFLVQKFNMDDKKGAVYPLEVYATKAVFQVIPDWDDVSKDATVAFEYTRKDDGTFTFGEIQKVKAVMSYEITKRAELPLAMGMESWTPEVVEAAPVAKSFWHGVI